MIRGRPITADDVQAVQQLVAEQRDTGRWGLARALCERWQWQASNGEWKIRSALAVLTELARRELIGLPLPSPSYRYFQRSVARPAKGLDPAASAVASALTEISWLRGGRRRKALVCRPTIQKVSTTVLTSSL